MANYILSEPQRKEDGTVLAEGEGATQEEAEADAKSKL